MAENRGRFQPGNKAAYVHGGRSSKTVTSTAQERLKAEALQSYPWLANQPVLLGLLLSQRADVEHYSERVAEHEKHRRARQAQQSREHKAKAESALLATLRQVEAVRTGGNSALPPGIEPWQLGQYRAQVEYGIDPDAMARHRQELIAKGVPPELLPDTQEAARRVGQARRAAFAEIKRQNPSLKPEDAAALVGPFAGYTSQEN